MPRRTWRDVSTDKLAKYLDYYPCPGDCPAHARIRQMFNVFTDNIIDEYRRDGKKVPLSKQMVDSWQMRPLIADFLSFIADAIRLDKIAEWPVIKQEYEQSKSAFMGLALGCLVDLCFNLEYVRRITDHKWAYCDRGTEPRIYYPYLGVCPKCILQEGPRPAAAITGNGNVVQNLTENEEEEEEEVSEAKARYFGNKIKSHHVGRIGEHILTFILDMLMRSHNPQAVSGYIIDDQHDVDSVFISDGMAILTQIKTSPLILLPVVIKLSAPLTRGTDSDTGLPLPMANHTFTDNTNPAADLGLYFALDDSVLSLGPKSDGHWPYNSFRERLTLDTTLKILSNWLTIYRSFEIPKRERRGDDIKNAYLTAGWGAPIDDNKTKAGLARSDNMMKGTYACLKYGAYYAQECIRHTIKAALVSNIDPAHQYLDYLQQLEDVRWGHDANFLPVDEQGSTGIERYVIEAQDLTYLFDSVFTFNRQILNDAHLRQIWNLSEFIEKLLRGDLNPLLEEWRQTPEEYQQAMLFTPPA